MNTQLFSSVPLGYLSTFGWREPELPSLNDIDTVTNIVQTTNQNVTVLENNVGNITTSVNAMRYDIDTDVILLRKPEVNAFSTRYAPRLNWAETIAGVTIFNENNWYNVNYLQINRPGEGDPPVSMRLHNALENATNVPSYIIITNEVIRKKISVGVKLKKINLSTLSFPSGNDILTEFGVYIKAGNKLNYPTISSNFIDRLNAFVTATKILPDYDASMVMGDNIINEQMYPHEIGRVTMTEGNAILSQVSNAVIGGLSSLYEPVETSFSVMKMAGSFINDIVNTSDMNKTFENERIPAGSICQYKLVSEDSYYNLTNLDHINLFHEANLPIVHTRVAEVELQSDLAYVNEPPTVGSDIAGIIGDCFKFGSAIRKVLYKNVRFDTTTFYNKHRLTELATELGDNGFVFAGDVLDLNSGSFDVTNYLSYVHKSSEFQRDRMYCQYKFRLNLTHVIDQFVKPGQAGNWVGEPDYNSIWIDDMPFGFFINNKWVYTRYATDLPV